jgi:site-specific DNA-methyltransferase (adenine-specific)
MIEILNIDCMEYMKTQPDKSFDLAIVDPPYFNGPNKLGYYGGHSSRVGITRKAYVNIKDWDVPGQEYFDELIRVSKHQIVWGINYYNIQNIGSGRIVWDKCNQPSNFSDCEIAYTSKHDSVRLFRYMWNGMLQGKGIKNGHIQEGNKKLNEKRIHPTQKPVKLYEWTYQTYATKGMRILDTHLGSASNAIVAHYFGCDFVGCEKNKHFFLSGKERFERETRQVAMF